MELAAVDDISSSSDPLSAVLAQLGERVAPVTLSRERTLPVADALLNLFPDGGLVRGRVMSCQGAAASSIAFAVAREAVIAGGWLAAVDVTTFGADAAAELGVPLERVVRIDTAAPWSSGPEAPSPETRVADWVDVMGAAADGFDIIVTRVPAALRGAAQPASVRKLAARFQQRGVVVVALGDTGALSSDVVLTTQRTVWGGLGRGDGHLRRRQIDIEATGRRQPGARTCSISLAGVVGRVELAVASGESVETDVSGDADPQAQVLAEMQAGVLGTHRAAG